MFLVLCECVFHFAGITSGRGYAHGEVGIAYIDIESVRYLNDIAFISFVKPRLVSSCGYDVY